MLKTFKGKEFASIHAVQEKCLNVDKKAFARRLKGRCVEGLENRGKWIFIALSGGRHLLLNLGMGADVLYYAPGDKWPAEYQCRFHMTDGSGFTCRFWWFGRLEVVDDNELPAHKATNGIGPSPLDAAFTLDSLRGILKARKQVKVVLMDQRRVGGIGNVYIHDILFRAGLHPKRPANKLTDADAAGLHRIMRENLQEALKKKGLMYERDFFGRKGRFGKDDFLVAYKDGQPCPSCGGTILKIKTGSTSSYICEKCQPLHGRNRTRCSGR
jgi:formamidopyrimidine-DNA glycosylase